MSQTNYQSKNRPKYAVHSMDFIHRKIGGEHVLVSVGKNIAKYNGYIELNDTAAYLWDHLLKPSTEDDLVTALQSEYDVDRSSAECDVREFLDMLTEHEMVDVDE